MKIIPNVISILRILLSVLLIFIQNFSSLFWITYFICGISDIMDGYIARKTNSVSKLGSLIDSISDIIFMGISIIIFLPTIIIPARIVVWIIFIAFIRTYSIMIAYYKYNQFAILHTYGNKITGLFLFISPFLYNFIEKNTLEVSICIIASISSIEELIIHLVSKELSRDIKGIFEVSDR